MPTSVRVPGMAHYGGSAALCRAAQPGVLVPVGATPGVGPGHVYRPGGASLTRCMHSGTIPVNPASAANTAAALEGRPMTQTARTTLPKEVARSVGLSVDSIGRYAREGLIPFETTPKGHRRYNVEEVQAALADMAGPSLDGLRASAPTRRSQLIAGPAVVPSASALMRESLRATRTILADTRDDPDQATEPILVEVLGHARRVLVGR
jgi:DNA-binding transcriptional MerR regulator